VNLRTQSDALVTSTARERATYQGGSWVTAASNLMSRGLRPVGLAGGARPDGSQAGSHSLRIRVNVVDIGGPDIPWHQARWTDVYASGHGLEIYGSEGWRLSKRQGRVPPGVLREAPAQAGVSARRRSAKLVAGMAWERFSGAILHQSDGISSEAKPLLMGFARDRTDQPSDILSAQATGRRLWRRVLVVFEDLAGGPP
jgi:hypothetical protein